MRRFLGILLSVLLLAPALQAEPLLPERRAVLFRDTDFYGGDLQSIFDISLDGCLSACLQQSACQGFTFNAHKNACFLKSDLGEISEFSGAYSARILSRDPAASARAEAKRPQLAFLSDADLQGAAMLGGDMSLDLMIGGWGDEYMLTYAAMAEDQGDYDIAARYAGGLALKNDTAPDWVEYARLSNAAAEADDSSRDKRLSSETALGAAITGFLLADHPGVEANALIFMADALEALGRGRDMIPALRLAQEIAPRDDTGRALSRALGLYGFRVTDTQVDAEAADPRICATFSEPLAEVGVDYAPFLQADVTGLAVKPSGNQLCITGLSHGERYSFTLRAGLPAASGEVTLGATDLTFYVRDRAPQVHFPGRAYVLAPTEDAGLPIVSVNAPEVELTLSKLSDRNLVAAFRDNYFGRSLDPWEAEYFTADMAEDIWSGMGELITEQNAEITTRLPIGAAIAGQGPGVYLLQAAIPGADPWDTPPATQWFVISDLGVTTLSGTDGLHVFTRGLIGAGAVEGASVELVSRANAVLSTATTDDQGHVVFGPEVALGRGGAEPAMVVVTFGEDMAFLSLTEPEFDLSDRGVEGRAAPGPIDVFLTTDRGAYRAGETVNATVLARDVTARAIEALPLTAVLARPDGVEYGRNVSPASVAGGHVFGFDIAGGAPRGTWRLEIFADPEAPALASTTLLVEDFLPERIDFDLALPEGPIRLSDRPDVSVAARYLFGAPGAELDVEGGVRVVPATTLPGWAGYRFGRYDDPVGAAWGEIASGVTDANGFAELGVSFPEIDAPGQPLSAEITVRVSEGSGRPVERAITTDLLPDGPLLGIRPAFDGDLAQGAPAVFDLIGLTPGLEPMQMEIGWEVNRVTTRYQWYQSYGSWYWEPVTTRSRVASGTVTTGDGPVQVTAPTDWGHYEIVATRLGGDYLSSSTEFYAGWYGVADTTTTPDKLEVALDEADYRPGDTATLRLSAEAEGTALITVLSNRLIDMKAVPVAAGETEVTLPVTEDWGAGAYVTATLIRPLDEARAPTRAMGLAYASVDPGPARLTASIDAPEEAKPRGPLDLVLHVEGISEGETAYATVALVDQGILNLTSFEAPDPDGHYFGQRRLGVGFRDLYGRLIDGRTGAMGQIRSGGDAMAQMRMDAPPPTEELVAYFSGPVQIGPDGTAQVSFDLPEFNGTVKAMAVVWSKTGVGQADKDILVRDPVVLTASVPRFMAPGDEARMLLELVHATGPAGEVSLAAMSDGLTIGGGGGYAADVTLAEQGTARLSVPLLAGELGTDTIDIVLTTPDGTQLTKTLTVPVMRLDPEVSQTTRMTLAPGQSLTLTPDLFSGLIPGSEHATLTAGPLARLDVAGLLARLDRYPYGCTEQQTSRALPLLYLGQVAQAMGLDGAEDLPARINTAITGVLANQAASGSFGLWAPGGGDLWLDAYVSDFLSRARAEGYAVPDTAFRAAMDNLRNRVNYYSDFDFGGEDLAYALYVLAREGAASMGDLRYYADVKGWDFGSPLARAQLGAALAAYGDPARADRMFEAAGDMLRDEDEGDYWRDDYGTNLRDAAGVLALSAEAGSQAVDRERLVARLTTPKPWLSTQEATWSLLAAKALVDTGTEGLTLDGMAMTGPQVAAIDASSLAAGRILANTGATSTEITVTAFGVPEVGIAPISNGYAIERRYFTTDGDPVDPSTVTQGTRLVTLLTISPQGHRAGRLMVTDPLPAGFEIDNPNLLSAGDIRALDWLDLGVETANTEFRQDRFLAAVDWRGDESFRLAYIVRAVTPGTFHHPAASVEDMYRPALRATGASGDVTIRE